MKRSLRNITTAFVLISLLPISYVVYELSTLNSNEVIIREIYKNQLDAILFSVNQYSEDAMSSVSNRIVNEVTRDNFEEKNLEEVMSDLGTVKHVFLLKQDQRIGWISIDSSRQGDDTFRSIFEEAISSNKDRIERLQTYLNAGFKKLQPDTSIMADSGLLPVFFAVGENRMKYTAGVMVIDLREFVVSALGAKMQEIAREKFIISVLEEKTNQLVYSTESVNPGGVDINQELIQGGERSKFLLLPGYYLSIALKGATVDELVNERIRNSMFVLSFVLLLLIAALVFVFRNVRKEIALSEAKSQFVSNVSHEIRTPLALIRMYAETLEMNRVPEARKMEYYSIITRESERLAKIVNRILNFSQLEANKKKFVFHSINLNELVQEVLQSYEIYLKETGFSCTFTPSQGVLHILADKEMVMEALVNLIDNAIKYSKEDKRIEVRTGVDKQFVFVEVQDHGIGIAKPHHHAIFDQFFRVPTGDVHNTKGSGLGLSLVKKTMDAHGGKIKVDSEPGQGSIFRLNFPAQTTT